MFHRVVGGGGGAPGFLTPVVSYAPRPMFNVDRRDRRDRRDKRSIGALKGPIFSGQVLSYTYLVLELYLLSVQVERYVKRKEKKCFAGEDVSSFVFAPSPSIY